MRGHPPSAAAAPLLRRTSRHAFPTPRGATGGVPPTPYAGGAPGRGFSFVRPGVGRPRRICPETAHRLSFGGARLADVCG